MSDEKMILDELRKKLIEMGVLKEGEDNARVEIPRDIRAEELGYIKQVKELMVQVESLLEHQIEQDKALVQDLHVKVNKLKHGGGL